jgi:hypothetical protein
MSLDTFFDTALELSMLALVWTLFLVRRRRFTREGSVGRRPFHRVRRLFRRSGRHGRIMQGARVA